MKKQLIKTDPEVIENMSISISIKFKPCHKENSLSWLHWCGEFYQTFTEETLPVTYQSSRKSHENVPVLAWYQNQTKTFQGKETTNQTASRTKT